MQFKLFTIPVTDTGKFIDEMNAFLRGNKILQVEKQFVNDSQGAYWSFCVQYIEKFQGYSEKTEKVDYKNILDDVVFGRFSKLRAIRKLIAAEDSIPAYMIFTDEELVELAKLEEITPKTMLSIKGIGEKKVEKFSERLIKEFNQSK